MDLHVGHVNAELPIWQKIDHTPYTGVYRIILWTLMLSSVNV